MTKSLCAVCGKPMKKSQGCLVVNRDELDQFSSAMTKWCEVHKGELAVTLSDMPKLVEWHWGHGGCFPRSAYEIDENRFDSIGKALDWTLHLMGKEWLRHTNWQKMVRTFHNVPNA